MSIIDAYVYIVKTYASIFVRNLKMPSEMENFAPRLRELRQSAGLTQGQLAEKVGSTIRSISRLETGDQEPTWPVVISLTKALGVDCRAFLEAPVADTDPGGRGRPTKQKPAADVKKAAAKKGKK